jgi:hypothetical protein
MERPWALRVRRSALLEPREEWPRQADPLLAPRRTDLAVRSPKLASRLVKTDRDGDSVAAPPTESASAPDRRAATDADSEADAAADPAAREVRSDQVGRWDGGTASGEGASDFHGLRSKRAATSLARRPDVLPSHLIRVDRHRVGEVTLEQGALLLGGVVTTGTLRHYAPGHRKELET